MTEDITPIVDSWLHEQVTLTESGKAKVAGLIRQTPQQRSWFPLPTLRFQSMFSATKFVVTGVMVALVGGFLLIAQPFVQQGSVPGGATGDAGTFSPTGSLAQPRTEHTATLLPDGRVLVVGGVDGAGGPHTGSTSAEVWDPRTDTFSPTGSLTERRYGHAATLLPDGRVLIAGGVGAPSAEVWDPETESFSPAGSLVGRQEGLHQSRKSALLPDGRVLVVGGDEPTSAEVWDPATGTFSPAGSLAGSGSLHAATLLPDGRVLVFGGVDGAVAEVWDPGTDTVSPAGSLTVGWSSNASLLPDGRVLIVDDPTGCGRGSEPACMWWTEVWDPATGTFSRAGSLPGADRTFYTVTALPDGGALIAGGCSYGDQECVPTFASAVVWDPETHSVSPAGEMTVTRYSHTATALPDGRVLVVGGWEDNEVTVHASAEVWEPSDASRPS
jgi:WD40 repeat protein